MSKPVAAIVGIGPGNGAALARRFAGAGHAVALLSRKRDLSDRLATELPDARAFTCDVADAASVKAAFAAVAGELGPVDTVVFNAGAGVWGTVEDITPEGFELSWRVNALGALLVAQATIPAMKAKGSGNFVIIGATASRRGVARTAAFAPAKAAQRSLAEAMARHLWPAGIHVAIIIIDGVIDIPATRQRMADKPDEFFVRPDDIAATALWLTAQHRSAWSFEVEARPFAEKW
jgi:NAD(P)-dependent dehydrogenase (short-subunit alcohol dehydrogenase family)